MTTWTDKDVDGAWERWRATSEPQIPEQALDDAMRRVLSYAASLLAARGGTMTAEDVKEALQEIGKGCQFIPDLDGQGEFTTYLENVAQHFSAQGAKVAALEAQVRKAKETYWAEVNGLRAEIARLTQRPSDNWRKRCEKAADALSDVAPGELGRLDLVGRINALKAERDAALAELARLEELACGTCTPEMTTKSGRRVAGELARLTALSGAKCGTCQKPLWSASATVGGCCSRECFDRLKFEGCDCRSKNIACIHVAMGYLKPSGQVAEDVARLTANPELTKWAGHREALSRLAALSQQGLEADVLRGQLVLTRARAVNAEAGLLAIRARARNWHELASIADAQCGPRDAAYYAVRHVMGGPLDPHNEDEDPDDLAATTPGAPKAQPVEAATGRCAAGTCDHTDAKEPGHAERVAERSKAFDEAAGIDPLDIVDANATTTQGVWNPTREQEEWFDSGADAMRAACWEVVQEQLRQEGVTPHEPRWVAMKAAIEGVTP